MAAALQDDRVKRDPSTHFIFQHRVFQLPDARFDLSGRERGPVLRVKLGDLDAVVPIDDVAAIFADKRSYLEAYQADWKPWLDEL